MSEELGKFWTTTLVEAPNPYARISDIAKRLGVEPTKSGSAVQMKGSDGEWYDVFTVAEAFLDRMDEVLNRTEASG